MVTHSAAPIPWTLRLQNYIRNLHLLDDLHGLVQPHDAFAGFLA
jgi:hypothetical protein